MFLQFELWKQCSMNCKFCYNKGISFKRDKIKSMLFILNVLNSEEGNRYDTVGLLAGECFNGEIKTKEENDLFYQIIDCLINKLNNNIIQRCLITSSMVFNNDSYFFKFCEYLREHKVESKFMICTSWDILGRFNDEKLKKWNDCMLKTHQLYPNLKLHTEMITTQAFLEAVLNNTLDLVAFKNKYNCRIDYIVPITGYGQKYKSKQEMEDYLPGFFPKRKTFFEFLNYMYNNRIFTKEDLEEFINIKLHSDLVYATLDDMTFFKKENRHITENKKALDVPGNFTGYLDSDIHPREDVETFLKLINEN